MTRPPTRSRARRWLVTGHAWVGLAASLLLAVIGATGTALVFKDDWIRLTVPGARDRVALDAAAFAHAAAAAEEAFGADGVAAVKFATPDLGVHRVYLADGGGAYLDGSGRVVDRWSANARAEDWLLDLHFKLLAGETGEAVVGVLGLIAVALAISGLVIWWPSRKSYRHRFVPRSAERRELLGTHRNTGVWAALPLLVLSLSGAAMIFHDASVALLSAVFGATEEGAPPAPTAAPGTRSAATLHPVRAGVDWRDVFAQGADRFPAGAARIASWPPPGGLAVVRYKQPSEWHPNGRSTLSYDPAAGRVVDAADAEGFGLGLKTNNAMYPLHSARIGGPLYALVVALSGLMLTSLGVLGAWSFLTQSRRNRVRERSASSSPRLLS